MDVSVGRDECAGAILAGGLGRRLGGLDKARLSVGGRRIVDRQLAALHALTDHVVLVARDPPRYADLATPVVADAVPGAGPLGGLYTALAWAPTPLVVVVACDMPFVTTALLAELAALARDADAAVPRSGGRWHPLCAAYASRCAPLARAALDAGRLTVVDWLRTLRVVEVDDTVFDRHGGAARVLLNVNTQADHASAERAEGARAPAPSP